MRIASLAPSVTEILYELGAQDQIVCSTIFCDYPEQARNLPKIGSWVNVDLEKLLELKPDIVFTSSAVQGLLTSRLKALGQPVVNINPMTVSEVIESYNQIGELVGLRQAAREVTNRLYKKVMSCYLDPHPARPMRVYCEEWSYPPMVAGNWVPELVGLAGGNAVLGRPGTLSRDFETAELIALDPEVIVLHICGMGEKVDRDSVKTRPGWEGITAVKNDKVFVVDDSLINRPTSRLFTGLEKLKEIISLKA